MGFFMQNMHSYGRKVRTADLSLVAIATLKKNFNYKVIDIIEYYNFGFDWVSPSDVV